MSDIYTKSGRRKSQWCSICGHTHFNHFYGGLPGRSEQIYCKVKGCSCSYTVTFQKDGTVKTSGKHMEWLDHKSKVVS